MCEILLIDDDPTQLRLREAVLREAGFTVGTAETASQALKALGHPELRKALGLIITDHVMPGPSGAAFARKLRRFSGVPVIVISGMLEAEEEYEGLDVGFIAKPCLPEDLIRHVRKVLRSN
ncbi:MAG: response regulator [Acidobacteria bacterium]|jgi:DNA-binding response OmpR family regulator|nr:MAG: response regulator [Acidobacteriota bacterium]